MHNVNSDEADNRGRLDLDRHAAAVADSGAKGHLGGITAGLIDTKIFEEWKIPKIPENHNTIW